MFKPRPRLYTALFIALAAAVLGPSAAPTQVEAAGTTSYDIEAWVAAQGELWDLDGDGVIEPWLTAWPAQTGGDLWVPPVANFWGWFDPSTSYLASIDYAGLAASYLEDACDVALGTTFKGSVTARDLGDGTELVSVRLLTRNALMWVADGTTGDFYSADLLFGGRAPDVCDGSTPGVGNSQLLFEYVAPAGGAIVDINRAGFEGTVSFRKFAGRAAASGETADGLAAHMNMSQTGVFMPHSQAPSYDGFPVEIIQIHPNGG